MDQLFEDRAEAGKALATALADYSARPDTIVFALPRGGVPVAYEVAKALSLPMDVWLVRKIGVPGHEELAMGAISTGDICYFNEDMTAGLNIPQQAINEVIAKERKELARRNALYRGDRPASAMKGKTAIIIDDGLATGATMMAAIESLRHAGAAEIIAAVPVGAPETCRKVEDAADKVICLLRPEPFYAVGEWYRHFGQTSDDEVIALLALQQQNAA